MAITQKSNWDDVGTEAGAGLAKYVVAEQPIAEWDNYFNNAVADDIAAIITAFESHDHYLEALKPLSVLLGSGQDVLLTATAFELRIRNAADSAYQSLRALKFYAEEYLYTDEIRERTNSANITFAHKAIFNAHLNARFIYEKNPDTGVTVDYCLIKDGKVANSDKVGGKQLADLLEVAAGDFDAFTEKASPTSADIVLIEDSAASYAKKKVQVGNLPGGGGSSTWLGLTDTPGAYTGQAGKYTKVNAGETALEFITLPGGGDMLKSIYDTGDNGVVDNSEKLEGSTKVQVRDHTPKSHIHYLEALKPLSALFGSGQDVLLTATAFELQIRNAADSAYQSLRASKLYAEDYVYTDEIRELTGSANITFGHKAIFNAHLNTSNIYERTADSGVTVDYCLIKDGKAANSDKVDNCHAGDISGNIFKIPSIAQGDVFFTDASLKVIKLAAGTSGHFLKTQGAAANPIWAAGAGGQEIVTATLIVAANDSKDKNRADYQCDGVEDNVQIQQALDALTAVGGKVVLLEGNYSGILDIDIESKQALVGQGPSTRLSGMDIEIEANASEILIADMYVNGNIDFKTFEIKDSIFKHLNGLTYACQNMATTSEGNLFSGVRAKSFKINGKLNRFSDCYAYIPSGTGLCFNLLSTATKNWLSNCHAHNGYDEDFFIQGTENTLIGCTSKDNRYIPIWFSSTAHRNVISGGMIDGGNVGAEGWSKLIRVQGDDNKISDMYIIVRETKTTHAIIIEAGADGNMVTDIRFENEGVGSPAEFSDSGTNTRLRDNVGFNRAWVTDV